MDDNVNSAYLRVYEELGLYRNEAKGIWEGCTFCMVGFEHTIESGKELILFIINVLLLRGASIFTYPNRKLENKVIVGADYYLCNYSMGFNTLANDILETKLVTPIWLYACHRDAQVYDAQVLPIFEARPSFQALMFAKDEITLLVVNDLDSKVLKNSADIMTRFARHCGFKIENLTFISSNAPPHGKTYFIIAQPVDSNFDGQLLSYVNKYKVPCVSIQWLIDCYTYGSIEDARKYYVDIHFDASTVITMKKRRTSSIDATIAACVQHRRIICLSFAAALDSSDEIRRMIRNDEVKIHVVNPIHLLAPWSMDVLPTRERTLYNNLSLVEDSRIILYVSPQEAVDGALGIFSQISILMEDFQYKHKQGARGIRNIEMHHMQNIYLKYPGPESAIPIPQELIAGESLVPRGLIRTFNLYDLADSIAFMGDDNMLMEEEEEPHGQDTYIRHSANEYSRLLREAELRWRDSK